MRPVLLQRGATLALSVGLTLSLLSACGGGGSAVDASTASNSSGQVAPPTAATGMTRFAAARASEQATFGTTTALVDTLSQSGLNSWITAQQAVPATKFSAPSWVKVYDTNNQQQTSRAFNYPVNEFLNVSLAAQDQLRLRVTWALLQFIPVNTKVPPYGITEYFNLLQDHAFGNYGSFLRALTIHPAMGAFLDNVQNRPLSDQCPSCAPNENYARELMQLFTIGVVKLNPDGTTQRDGQGKPIETYSQDDVEELARALTGWRFSTTGAGSNGLPSSNWINAAYPMVPETWEGAHDKGAKVVMGTSFPAGRTASQELDQVVAMLMSHPNIAPFVSVRLIQHLVTSNPTPEYVGRVSAVFRNNGSGVAGDMKAVVRAILMDPEARRGDVPGTDSNRFGKFREPVLWYTGLLRGLGCTSNLNSGDDWIVTPTSQSPFNAPSVFSFYLPTDRAPGSNLLAPEQKIINASELTSRLGRVGWIVRSGGATGTGCNFDLLGQAFAQSPKALIDRISLLYFRGAMPPTLRSDLMALATGQQLGATATESALVLTQYALTTPFYGVIK